MTATRERAVGIGRSWIGTPYHHQASLKGVGADCIGLIAGIYRELTGSAPLVPATYTRDWAEATGAEMLIDAARAHLVPLTERTAAPGDILIFRYRAGFPAKHAGLRASATTFIHAMEGCRVAEVPFCGWWQRHVAAAFAFPEVL